jgi:outer membrane protein assembly factor BamA
LRVLAGLHAERWKIDTLSGASQLAADAATGVDPAIGRTVGDVSARVGLVFDTRNDEPAPTSGVLLEAIVGFADSSIAGGVSYTRTNVSATAYVPLRHNLGVAVRLAGQTMSGTPPLGAFYHFESSERPFLAMGGTGSHRALPNRRLLDADKLLVNLDVRYDLIVEPTLFKVTAVGFLDAGRVFPTGDFELTTDDLKVGGGAGLFIKLFRSAVIGTTTGVGPDGVIVFFHTWWPF